MRNRHTTYKRIALLTALMLCLAAAPALAGPQNGEVNHHGEYGQDYRPCAGEIPDRESATMLDELLELLEVWFSAVPSIKVWGFDEP